MSSAKLVAESGKILDVASKDAPLTVRGLTVSYGNKPAVFSVDASIPAGSMTAIIGPNGAGKSTFLKGALGVVPRLSGEVRIFGKLFEDARDRVAYVPQRASVAKCAFLANCLKMPVIVWPMCRNAPVLIGISRHA